MSPNKINDNDNSINANHNVESNIKKRKIINDESSDCNNNNSSLENENVIICMICNMKPSLYRCPGCHIRTCSLNCCKTHKEKVLYL